MPRFIFHSIFLVLAVVFTFVWTDNPTLNSFTLQLVGLIILFYFITRLFSGSRGAVMAIDALIFTIIAILIVETSGGLTSPVFFLYYFLLFALSLLFEPTQSVILSLTLAIFLALRSETIDTQAAINLTTLLLITPLSIIFGKKYLETMQAEGKIKVMDQIIAEEETETLIWLSTKAKPTIVSLLDTTSQIIGSNLLPGRLQEKLKILHADLIALHQSANDLEKDIDKKTD